MKNNSILIILLFPCIAAIAIFIFLPWDARQEPAVAKSNQRYLLAISWQPAFCETRPNKPECRSQRAGRIDAKQFSLHGLWPQPRGRAYCGVASDLEALDRSGRWLQLPKLNLAPSLRQRLSRHMPGYRSGLHRHEWYKHGTCIEGLDPQQYFEASLDLLEAFNASGLGRTFARSIGQELSFRDIARDIEDAFGRNAGQRIIVDCTQDGNRRIITEIKLSLGGDLLREKDLNALLSAGDAVGRSCPRGIVDPVGLQ